MFNPITVAVVMGSSPRVYFEIKSKTGTRVDPGAVYFKVKDPENAEEEYQYGVDAEVIKEETGLYYLALDCDLKGKYYCRWLGTGVNKSAAEIIVDSVSAYES